MEAGLTDRVWEMADPIGLLDAADKKAASCAILRLT
jgi:hypothetical protein